MSKKSTFIFVITLIVLIIGVSAVSAADVSSNDTSVSTVDIPQSTTHTVSSDVVKVDHKTTEVSQATKEIKTVNVTKEKTTKTAKKTSKNLKKDTQTHVVTNQTYTQFFTSGKLNDNVTRGDVLDLQGNFISSQSFNYTMTINKPVNIISTTHDSNISLNSTSTDFFGESYGNAFTITRNGSGSNITGIYFYNTQLYINNTENVTLNNITVINEGQVVGGGIGVTSIRGNSSYITVKNSYFKTKNNGGHSTLVGAYVNHCIFDNNTIIGEGTCGNLMYLTTYNVDIPDYNHSNEYNTISNNRIYGPSNALAICYGICIAGCNNLIENNTVEYNKGQGIINQWGSGTTTEGNVGVLSIDNIYRNNVLLNGSYFTSTTKSLVVNNTVTGTASIVSLCDAYNNNFNATRVQGTVKLHDNNMTKLTVQSSNSGVIDNYNITNNNISGNVEFTAAASSLSTKNITLTGNTINGNITVTGNSGKISDININSNIINGAIVLGPKSNQKVNNVTITNNLINSTYNTAVILSSKSSNITVSNNTLYAKTTAANNAVDNKGTGNVISDNLPLNYITITDDTYNNYFDDDGIFNYTVPFYIDKIVLEGAFINNNIFTFVENNLTLTGKDENTLLYNATITIDGDANFTINNLKIISTDIENHNSIILNTEHNTVDNVTIIQNATSGKAQVILINADNNQVINSNITVTGPSDSVDYFSDPAIAPTVNIIVSSNNNTIANNYLYTYASTASGYGTIESVTVQAPTGVTLENNKIINNTVRGNGTDYIYGLNLGGNVNNNILDGNNINITSKTYANGIQFFQSPAYNNTITNNIIDVTAGYSEGQVTYGLIFSSWNDGNFENNLIHNNTIYVKGNETYGIEIFSYPYGSSSIVKNTTISNNTIISNGTYAEGIALMSNDYNITGNTILVTGTTNATRLASADWIKPTTAGIILQQVKGANVTYNRVNVTTGPGFKILDRSSNINITNNTVYTTQGLGDESVLIVSGSNVNVTDNLPIIPRNTTITIDGTLLLYKNNTINITLIADNGAKVNSTILVTINNDTRNVTLTNGAYTFTYKPTTINDVTITVLFNGTIRFVNSTASKTIKVIDDRTTPIITIDGNLALNKPGEVTITLKDVNNTNLELPVYITFNGNTFKITISNGTYTFTTTPSSIDDLLITTRTDETEQYLSSNLTKALSITETRINTTINIDGTLSLYKNNTITVTLKDANDNLINSGNVLVTIGDITRLITINDGIGTFTYNPNNMDDVIITANFNATNTYLNSTNTAILTVTDDRHNTTITSNNNNYVILVNNALIIKGVYKVDNIKSGVDGLIVTIDGVNTSIVNTNNGKYSYTYIPKTTGTHTIIISYNGNETCKPSNTTITIKTMGKSTINTNIPETITVNKIINLIANVTDEQGNPITGTITMKVNNKIINSLTDSSTIKTTYLFDTIGDKVITITYTDPNGIYADNTITLVRNINTIPVTMNMTPVTGIIKEETPITVTVVDMDNNTVNNGTVKFVTNDGTILGYAQVDKGLSTITTIPTNITNTKIEAQYMGTDIYRTAVTETTLNVNKVKTAIAVDPINVKVGETTNFTARITAITGKIVNNGNVIFKLNGVTIKNSDGTIKYIKVVNGTATLTEYTIPDAWAKRTIKISAVYHGNNQYDQSRSTNYTLNITKREAKLTVLPITASKGSTVTLTTKITDKTNASMKINSGKVVFKLNGVTLKDNNGNAIITTVKNGTAILKYTIPSSMASKNYKLTAVFMDDNYNRVESNNTLTIKK
jgi:hypothetical protein